METVVKGSPNTSTGQSPNPTFPDKQDHGEDNGETERTGTLTIKIDPVPLRI